MKLQLSNLEPLLLGAVDGKGQKLLTGLVGNLGPNAAARIATAAAAAPVTGAVSANCCLYGM
ncbi:MAG UNVERIFIED_CONTAM: hypothetical protein LVR18_03790 [Planctomycetaceae bacterium]